MTTIDQDRIPITAVPTDVLEALLRDHLADQTAVITDSMSAPLAHQGTNDSTSFFRVTFSWALSAAPLRSHTTSWIIKRWKAGGQRDSSLGIIQPREVLAWERGWLRPAGLPAGVVVPFVGAWRSPDNAEAWLAMADVSTELSAYQRMSLPGDTVIGRTRAILARLAQFHAMWEQPQRQAELRASPWLLRPEMYLWAMAPTYAQALGRAPHTLLHNDLDDRNIGLRPPSAAAESQASAFDSADLVLIDWEWIAVGPAAVDVANIIQRVPVMISPGAAIPAAIWNDELIDHYFAHYRAAGGRCVDAAQWRRSFGLALVAHGLTQMPFIHGSLRRSIRGEQPVSQIIGVPEAVIRQNLRAGLPMMEQMEQRVVREARRWLGSDTMAR
jgi:hypothetical protein